MPTTENSQPHRPYARHFEPPLPLELPENAKRLLSSMKKAWDNFSSDDGRDPTDSEWLEETNAINTRGSIDVFSPLKQFVQPKHTLSIEQDTFNKLPFSEMLVSNDDDPVDPLLTAETNQELKEELFKLPANLRLFLVERYGIKDGEYKTLSAAGRNLGLGFGEAGHMERLALALLRRDPSVIRIGRETGFLTEA